MLLECASHFRSVVSKKLTHTRRRPRLRSSPRGIERLETRELLATFLVTNLRNDGAGSFRQAIIASNMRPGPDIIDFDVAGTILNCKTPLPAITGTVTIDGSTAPSFTSTPVVTLNFQKSSGLRFAKGSDGSILRDICLVNAGNAGVTLTASDITLQGNYIGVLANGMTVAGNRGDGVQINASSHDDLIGQNNPVSSISYYNADGVSTSRSRAGKEFADPRPAASTSSPEPRRSTACSTKGPSRGAAARVTRSTTRTPRPPASTVPMISAATAWGWSGVTRPVTIRSTASSSRALPLNLLRAQLSHHRLSQRAVHIRS